MARLRVFSGQDVIKLLAGNGFTEIRRRGSHVVMQGIVASGTVTVVVPNHREIRVGTLLSIIRQSQLPRTLFET